QNFLLGFWKGGSDKSQIYLTILKLIQKLVGIGTVYFIPDIGILFPEAADPLRKKLVFYRRYDADAQSSRRSFLKISHFCHSRIAHTQDPQGAFIKMVAGFCQMKPFSI